MPLRPLPQGVRWLPYSTSAATVPDITIVYLVRYEYRCSLRHGWRPVCVFVFPFPTSSGCPHRATMRRSSLYRVLNTQNKPDKEPKIYDVQVGLHIFFRLSQTRGEAALGSCFGVAWAWVRINIGVGVGWFVICERKPQYRLKRNKHTHTPEGV